jgi:hypothetical protein
MPETASSLSLDAVLGYLEDSDRRLLHELDLSRDILNRQEPGRWSTAQVVEHLVRAETVMLAIWTVVPKLQRWPALARAVDRGNTRLWRRLGLRVIEPAGDRITPANATSGKYSAPGFLSPPNRPTTYHQLVENRAAVRRRTLRAISNIPEGTLDGLSWSLPHSGTYSLVEIIQFIGIHETHHLPQMRRIRERVNSASASA